MQRTLMWRPWESVGLEHVEVVVSEHSVLADGLVVAVGKEGPFRLRYELRLDADWRTRRLRLEVEEPLGQLGERRELFADGEGAWTDDRGDPLPGLDGCLDVALPATPLSHTLPVRRLGLEPGAAAEAVVACVAAPSLEAEAATRRYTCVSTGEGGARYVVEAGRRERAELALDPDGFVLDEPQRFWRVWPPGARPPAEA